jgi:hypothetical protein
MIMYDAGRYSPVHPSRYRMDAVARPIGPVGDEALLLQGAHRAPLEQGRGLGGSGRGSC